MDYCFGCMEHTANANEPCSCGFTSEKYIQQPHYLPAGTLLKERYLVGSVLGQGGFGITYIGRDIVLDMKVAIKEFYMSEHTNRNTATSTEISAAVGLSEEIFEKNKAKFLTEARTLAKLDGEEGVVNVKDFFEDNNTAYIVMEFLSGETLVQRLRRAGVMTTDEVFLCMQSVFKSLSKLHSLQLVHRDISPDNIMLTKEGKVKLFDFGAAMVADQSTEIVSRSVVYKSGFAPEEQFYSKGQIGPWTDIYALCATIYYCITGKLPDSSLERLSEDNMPSPNELTADCPIAFSNVIMKGMSVRRKDRYQSIEELENALSLAMEGVSDTDAEPVPNGPEPETSQNGTVYAGKSEPSEPVATKDTISPKGERPKKKGVIIIAIIAAVALVAIALIIVLPKLLKHPDNNVSDVTAAPSLTPIPTGIPVSEATPEITPEATPGEGVAPEITPEAQATPEVTSEPSAPVDETQKLYDELDKFTVYINGQPLALPCSYADLAKLGWEIKDPADLKTELRPNKKSTYAVINMSDAKSSIYVLAAADSTGYTTINDAYIIGIDLDDVLVHSGSASDIRLTDDLVLGVSSYEAFHDKTGLEPAESTETASEYRHIYYFSDDSDNAISLLFTVARDGSYSILREFAMELAKVPISPSAIVDAPLTVSGGDTAAFSMPYYLQLNRPTNTVTNGEIHIGVPLNYYLNQGWKLSEDFEYLSAGDSKRLTLTADPRTKIELKVVNPSKKAHTLGNCIVTEVTLGSGFLLTDDVFALVAGEKVIDLRTPYKDDIVTAYESINAQLSSDVVKIFPFGSEDLRYIKVDYLATSKNFYSVKLCIPDNHLSSLIWE